jgi:hypothetical protein
MRFLFYVISLSLFICYIAFMRFSIVFLEPGVDPI